MPNNAFLLSFFINESMCQLYINQQLCNWSLPPASTINNLAVPAPSISTGTTSFAAVVLAAAAAAKENQSAGPAEAAKPVLRRPLPNARSRWKKLTGTAMFINRLGKRRVCQPDGHFLTPGWLWGTASKSGRPFFCHPGWKNNFLLNFFTRTRRVFLWKPNLRFKLNSQQVRKFFHSVQIFWVDLQLALVTFRFRSLMQN